MSTVAPSTAWLPAIPYPPPDQPGYWDPVTSTLQWCEEDYYATYYAAEIVNTLTNLMFIWLAFVGWRSCQKHGHDFIFSVAYVGYFLVGIGSFMFHTTLKYPWQLVDELNMIYTTCLMAYASFSYARPTQFRIILGAGLIALSLFITLYYHYLQDPLFHQNVYALLTATIVFRSMYIMESELRPSLRSSKNKRRRQQQDAADGELVSQQAQRIKDDRDAKILKNMWVLVAYGLSIFLGGFALWGVDRVHCSTLRTWRRSIGLPWGIFLEGHGWWHLMTGLGAYCYIVWGIWLRHCLNGRQDEYVLVWPRIYRLPEIVHLDSSTLSSSSSSDPGANGPSSKKTI